MIRKVILIKSYHFIVSAEEIQRLYKRFMKLDKDKSGSIDKEEFLSIPQIANNPLASRMIAIFDEDGGGDVDFGEFIKGLSAFSARGNKREKLQCKQIVDYISGFDPLKLSYHFSRIQSV